MYIKSIYVCITFKSWKCHATQFCLSNCYRSRSTHTRALQPQTYAQRKKTGLIPKPGKPSDSGTSNRPISFFCSAIKVLNHLLHPDLISLRFSPTQQGFRTNHSTISTLLSLAHRIARGFNYPCPPHRTLTTAIDFPTLILSPLINDDDCPQHLCPLEGGGSIVGEA